MKSASSTAAASSRRSAGAKRAATVGLRTGKIHAGKATATAIRNAVGVTKADERLAIRALAAAAPKAKAAKRSTPAAARKTAAKPRANAKHAKPISKKS